MEFFKKRSDVFFRGVGAEFVLKTSDGISLVSGGKILKVRLVGPTAEQTNSRLVLEEHDGHQHVIFEGAAVTAAAMLVEIAEEATSKRTVITPNRKGIYAILAAFTAVYLIFCHPGAVNRTSSEIQATSSELSELIKTIPSVAGVPNSLPLPALQPPVPSVSSVVPTITSPVLDRPSFLSLPEEEISNETADEVETSEAPIPKYTPDLYKSSVAPSEQGSAAVKTQPAVEPIASAGASAPEAATAPNIAPVDQLAENKNRETTDAVATTTEVTITETAMDGVPATEVGTGEGATSEAPVEDPEAAANAAKSAAMNMSALETAELLKQIEQMMDMDPTAITPDMLAKLPHEIAHTLRNSGAIGNPNAIPERGDAPYAAIRLPAGVIDNFRGKDGIASIPENDTFAALGNKIPLQLPGGGDIRTPEDLRLFGFEP